MDVTEQRVVADSGLPVVVAVPESSGSLPPVVLLHERFGLVQHTLNKAKRLAESGYLVASPDLFYRHPDPASLHAATDKYLPADAEVTQEVGEVAKLLERDFAGDLSRLTVIGFCQTGRYPMVYAASNSVRACVTFYGGLNDDDWAANELNPKPFEEFLDDLNVPLLGIYAEQDGRIPVSDVVKFRNALERRNKSYQFSIYNGMPHGWLNETIPERYRPAEAERAWQELLVFLDRYVLHDGFDPSAVSWTFNRN